MTYHFIPAIEYGDTLPVRINLAVPEKGMGDGDQPESNHSENVSLSGRRQVQVNFVDNTRKVTLQHLDETAFAAVQAFFYNHAYLGKPFKWFEDQTSVAFVTYELKDLKMPSKKTGFDGANAFFRTVDLTFRRVQDEPAGDDMTALIANSQASPADVVGLLLDNTLYTSVIINCEIRRKTDTSEEIATGHLTAVYRDDTGAWDITPTGSFDHDFHGCTFSMSGAQVQYISDTLAGANYIGTIKVRNLTI